MAKKSLIWLVILFLGCGGMSEEISSTDTASESASPTQPSPSLPHPADTSPLPGTLPTPNTPIPTPTPPPPDPTPTVNPTLPTPTPPISGSVMRDGLAAWRTPDAQGMACANCHAPDAFDLAVGGFSDTTIVRRGSFHLSAVEVQKIVSLVHALREQYHLPARDPMGFRPLQPGGQVLAGDSAQTRDLAFGQELREMGLLMATGEVNSLEKAKVARDQLLAINLRTLKVGIPFNRYSEDPFHGSEHDTVADWLPQVPHIPLPAQASAWYALHDAYLANPTDENLRAIYDQVASLTTSEGFIHQTLNGKHFMLEKYRSVLLLQHLMRHESSSMPERMNSVWGVGKFTHDNDWFQVMFVGSSLETPTGEPQAMMDQFTAMRIPWLWAGWTLDRTLRHSAQPAVDFGCWSVQSCLRNREEKVSTTDGIPLLHWIWVAGEDPTPNFEKPTGYPIHAAFFVAVKNLSLAYTEGAYLQRNIMHPEAWRFKDFAFSERYPTDRPFIDYALHGRYSSAHRDLYIRFTKNLIRTFYFLMEEALARGQGGGDDLHDLIFHAEKLHEFLIASEPTQCQANASWLHQIIERLDPGYRVHDQMFPEAPGMEHAAALCQPPAAPAAIRFEEAPYVLPAGKVWDLAQAMIPHPSQPLLADLDGDGDQDIMVPTQGFGLKPSLRIYRQENGRFPDTTLREVPLTNGIVKSGQFQFGRFNRDRFMDTVVLTDHGSLQVVRNGGSGGFEHVSYLFQDRYVLNSLLPSDPLDFAVLDLNRDGLDEIVVFTADEVLVLANTGAETTPAWFQVSQAIALSSDLPFNAYASRSGDFNGDGRVDLFRLFYQVNRTHSTSANDLRIDGRVKGLYLMQNAQGVLIPGGEIESDALHQLVVANLELADVTGDGFPDLLFGQTHAEVVMIDGSPFGNFAQIARPAFFHAYPVERLNFVGPFLSGIAGSPIEFHLASGDIDGDGDLDLIARNANMRDYPIWGDRLSLNNVIVLFNEGGGRGWRPERIDLPTNLQTIRSGSGAGILLHDFDRNGVQDVALTTSLIYPGIYNPVDQRVIIVHGFRR